MPDRRSHRGPHPRDAELFAPEQLPALRRAVDDLSWLLGRGYAEPSARKLVGDRYALRQRQRLAMMRCACGEAARQTRQAREVPPDALPGRTLLIDGYNALTTLEAALGGGVLLLARDGCLRDIASMHGSYRKVAETRPALTLLGEAAAAWGVARCVWLLDRPVSNSGRLRNIMAELAEQRGWDWTIQLVQSPDRDLARSDHIIATADSAVLDRCGRWFNLARRTVAEKVPHARPIELNGENPQAQGL